MFTNVWIKFVDGYLQKLFDRPVARHGQGVQVLWLPTRKMEQVVKTIVQRTLHIKFGFFKAEILMFKWTNYK